MVLKVSMPRFLSIIIALLPFIYLYRIDAIQVNCGLICILLIALYGLIKMVATRKGFREFPGIIIITIVYLVFNSLVETGVRELGIFMIGLLPTLWLYDQDLVDVSTLKKAISVIAAVSAIVVIMQSIAYYLFGIVSDNRVLLPFASMLEDKYYFETSMFQGSLFRPSGFFLEPSHFIQYSVAAIACLQFDEDNLNGAKISKLAILISIGCILTTSGMGIVLVPCIWAYFAVSIRGFSSRKLRIIVSGIIVVAIAFLLLSSTTFFGLAIDRILGTGTSTETSYAGRMYTSYFLNELNGVEKWIGRGFQNIPRYTGNYRTGMGYYMTGIVELQYCLGYIGTFLVLVLVIYYIVKRKNYQRLSAIIFLVFIFIAAKIKLVDFIFYSSLVFANQFRMEDGIGDTKNGK